MVREFKDEYRFLSNFWPSRVELDGVIYPTVEHAYQAAKTLIEFEREAILQQPSPGAAKRTGAKITLRADWDEVRVEIMTDLVRQKFRDPQLRYRLSMINGEIVEGNAWDDTFWGVDLQTGKGENHLGQILMAIRDE